MKYVEIMACCYSEKAYVSANCEIGFEYDNWEEESQDLDWLEVGMSEYFQENYFEFEAGIEKSKKLMEENKGISFKDALFMVFGNFNIEFEVSDESLEFNPTIDVNKLMYSLFLNE